MSETRPERRRFTRIHFDADTLLRSTSGEWPVKLVDICFQGALTECPEGLTLQTGDTAQLIITLDSDSDAVIDMPVVMNHKLNHYLGFKAKSMDLESMTHLRRLVELNLGDPDSLERELDHLYHD